jgi:hypothetical protein
METTPKAFATFSPSGLELATTLGHTRQNKFNAASVGQTTSANAFSVGSLFSVKTQGWSNPGLKFANAFSVFSN